MSASSPDCQTRSRLLAAAGTTFAERGFRAATIREICERANANVAAVHYHFGDKEALYLAVLKFSAEAALKKFPPDLGLTGTEKADEKLHAFVRSILLRTSDKGRPAWQGKLMVQEMAEPTAALDVFIKDVYRPLIELLETIICELTGRAGPDATVLRCVRSVLGQCLYYYHSRPVIHRMTPHQQFGPADIEELAEHITRFSLAGIRQAMEP